ncbi:DUF503 family protein [Caldibacillus lycopersici]|uniref:DUF503 family protein n=1 Tax=Perspicuibacillus lycopersici TaxID=1325689 RepID=A0AAE3IQW7_9BACI|nr:DUF503 family protein [Perspicuibacillus lycopersici]MCU9612063.1 DUF503 family protein [Perspicuibacillus lycopersici]
MILSAEVECIIYDAHSLKQKRSVLKRIITRIQQRFNLAIAEIDHQDVWQRTKLAIVTVSSSKIIAEKELQQAFELIDSFPEIERGITQIEWL